MPNILIPDPAKADGAPVSGGGGAGDAENVGTGEGGIFKQVASNKIQLKTIKAGPNVSVTNGASEVTVTASGGGGALSASMVNEIQQFV